MKLAIPLSEFLEHYPVGEALAADPDAFQDTITAKLIEHEMRVQFSSLREQTTGFRFHLRSLALVNSEAQPALALPRPPIPASRDSE